MQAAAANLWHGIGLEQWGRAFRHAGRGLTRAPGFSIAVFCSLAICIGPNAATLSALYALVLKPLPFPEPAQLVTIVNVAEKTGGQVVQSSTTQYLDFKHHADLFAGFATIRHDTATLDDADAPSRVAKDAVSADFFAVLGVQPVAGRLFRADEETAGHDRVLVLNQNFWEAHYHSDPRVIGSEVRLAGVPYTIIGVAPRSLDALSYQTCFFQPYAPAASKFDPQTRTRGDLILIARLKPGTSVAAALAQLIALERNFVATEAGPPLRALITAAGYRLAINPLRPGGWVGATSSLWLLQGGALLVLVIGCVNVANLFLARMNTRRSDLAIRIALGAGRADLLRQTLTESVLLTAAAVTVGLGLAVVGVRVFNRYLPVLVAGAPPVHLDVTVISVMVATAATMALIVGFLPVHFHWRTGLNIGGPRTATSPGWIRRMSGALVTAQVSFAVILLVGASLLLRSFAAVTEVEPGFDADKVVEARTTLPARYGNAASRLAAQRRIVAAFREIPGVDHVALSLTSVFRPDERPVPFGLRGESVADLEAGSQHLIHITAVSADYFATLGMRVRSGRAFDDADEFPKNPVAIVDDSFVERYFPGQIVEGKEIYLNWGFPLGVDGWPRIVGVVSRATFTGLDSKDNLPFVFVSSAGYASSGFAVLIRSRRPAADLLHEMRVKLHAIDPSLPLFAAGSLQAGLDQLLMARRGTMLLLTFYSGLALLLAAIGLYGILSYDVSQRTREIGIRGAIGASGPQIVALILRQGMKKMSVGLAAGMLGAVFLTRYVHLLLFKISPADPTSYAAVFLVLVAVCLIACWLPARRAAKVDPIVALRTE